MLSCVIMLIGLSASTGQASLQTYDQAIEEDRSAGISPLATLTSPVTFTGANKAAFNFGHTSGDVTMEFILEGDPVPGSASKYLAVGSNVGSNLRYEQWSNTGQLGFTELGASLANKVPTASISRARVVSRSRVFGGTA